MSELVSKAELLRSLGRLVRGLSALFWGMPLALIVCVHTAKADSLQPFGVVPPLAATALLVFGVWQLGDFQKQERVWGAALGRVRVFSLINFGLSPFLYWWNKIPANPFFLVMVMLMALSALLFLASLNLAARRLSAMLPDEALRLETRQFTTFNLNLLLVAFLLALLYIGLSVFSTMPLWLRMVGDVLERSSLWYLILLLLLPLALTMALLWKTKEVIFESVFHAHP